MESYLSLIVDGGSANPINGKLFSFDVRSIPVSCKSTAIDPLVSHGISTHKSGDTFVSGNTVTYEWVYGGTYTGDWYGTDIKDKKFSIKGISTTTINNKGKITFQKDYYDMLGFQKQLGIIKWVSFSLEANVKEGQ